MVRNVWYRNVRIFIGYYDVPKGGRGGGALVRTIQYK
jgi:hypothetical protein